MNLLLLIRFLWACRTSVVELFFFFFFCGGRVLDFELKVKLSSYFFFLSSAHQRETLHDVIHVRGCIHAVNLWMSDNIGITIALCCAIGLPQVIENSRQPHWNRTV